MSHKPVPKRWTDALSPGDPLREALLAARAEVPGRDRLERVYGSILAAGGGLGGDGSSDGGDDGGDLDDGPDGSDPHDGPDADVPDADVPDADVPDADVPDVDVPDADVPDVDGGLPEIELPGDALHPDGGGPAMPPIVVPPVPAPIAAAGLGAAGLASTGVGATGLGSGGGVVAVLGTTLGKTIGVGVFGSASIAAALWIAAPAEAPVEPVRARTVVAPPVSSTPARDEVRPPAIVAPPRTSASVAPALPSGSSSAASSPDDPDAEIALLRDAQAAASSAPMRALALIDESERRFPRSALAQERVVIRVQALLAAGRRDEALARARAFVAANPGTAHRPRLEQLLPELTL